MRIVRTVVIQALFALAAFGQGTPVNQVSGPPPTQSSNVLLPFYDAGNNAIYICASPLQQAATTQKRSDSTLTNIVVLTNVGTVTTSAAHGLYIGARVTISGATVDTDLNATYVVTTIPSTTTYTIATVSVANATYTEATLVITTTNPLTTRPIWALLVDKFASTSANANLIYSAWQTSIQIICDNRTQY